MLSPTLNVEAAARRRRSIRSYVQDPIPREDLLEILHLTSLAPSAFNLQPWRFAVVESPERKAKVGIAAYDQKQITSAPAVIVLYTDMADTLAHLDEVVHPNVQGEPRAKTIETVRKIFAGKSESEREAWGAEQGNIALGYLLLAAEGRGYQTSPMAGFNPSAVKEALSLPTHVRIPALVAIGRGAEEGYPHHRHPLERIARFV